MARTYSGCKNRKGRRRAYALYHDVVLHPLWVQLSVYAKLLWIELGLEYLPESKDGKFPSNNGWIACPYNYLINERGFKSRTTIKKKLIELEWYGFIEKTYPGSFPKEPARYALTHLDYGQSQNSNMKAKKAPHTYRSHSGDGLPTTYAKN